MAGSARVAVPVGSTAVALAAASTVDQMSGNTFVVYNAGAVAVLLGGADVSSSNGWRGFAVGAVLTVDIAEGETLYGLVPSGGTVGAVDVLRVN